MSEGLVEDGSCVGDDMLVESWLELSVVDESWLCWSVVVVLFSRANVLSVLSVLTALTVVSECRH